MPSKSKNGKINLSPEEVAFIKSNWETMTNPALANHLGLRLTRLRYFLSEMGLKRMEMEYWTPDQVQFLNDNYEEIGDVEMAEIFEAQWPKMKLWTNKHIRKKRCYLKLHRSCEQVDRVRRRNVTAGRYNTVNQKWKTTGITPIGTVKIWHNSNQQIHFPVIRTEAGFVHYYRWLYIQTHGPLTSDQLVVPKKGVLTESLYTAEQLEIVDRAEHARRNAERRMQYPEDLREISSLKNKLIKKLNTIDHDGKHETSA